jgi:membrane-bound serine protease (ClpP class)
MKRVLIFCLFIFSLQLNAEERKVIQASFDGIIGTISSRYMEKVIRKAEEENAECVVFLLDTPGGHMTAMKNMVKSELNSKVPIVVFVYPRGGGAVSAGVFITLAAHIAAMSPGTNIGAAHPVAMGKKMDEEMKKKVTNDAVAYIETIAQERSRNVEWARDAVKKSISVSAEEALEKNVVDVIARDVNSLLVMIDGMEVEVKGEKRVLHTKNIKIEEINLSFRENFLNRISNPNIAYILLTMGSAGLVYEITHPGAIFPGVFGAVCLILAFFAFQTLPFSYAGIALIIMAMIMFFLETRTPTNGPLTAGGIASMLLGSAILFDTDAPFLRASWGVMLPIIIFIAAFFLFVAYMVVRVLRRKPTTGKRGLVGEIASAKSKITPGKVGSVFIHGEFWDAVSEEEIKRGEEVEILSVEGLKLKVKKKKE